MEELIFGSEEWMNELNRRVKFPQMFAIYYGIHKENENENNLTAVIIDTKSTKPNNMKYGSIKPTLTMALSPYKWLLEDVYYIESAERYLDKMNEISKRWKVDFNG